MDKKMLLLELLCPYCRHKLTEGDKVTLDCFVEATGQDGQIVLSALFGDYAIESDTEIPEGGTVQFRCPQCDASIMLQTICKQCGAHMASLELVEGGHLEFCSRRGCRGHALGGIGDIDQMMSLMNRMFETPYD